MRFLQPIPLCFRRRAHNAPAITRGKSTHVPAETTDSCGIPLKPTWSVNELLSSYPSPTLSNSTINRLYELSALIPPQEGTTQYDAIKKSLEGMVRLVEAVRLVDTSDVSIEGRGEKEDADRRKPVAVSENGQKLLEHAERTHNGFYVVDSERRRC